MNGTKHLSHIDQLRINRDRSDKRHKVKAVMRSIRQHFFGGKITWTVDNSGDSITVHVLENKSHRNAVQGIQAAATNRFGIDTEIVEQDGYRTVIKFDI